MTHEEILDKLQEKINQIHREANKSLSRLNKKARKRYSHIKSMHECNESYYIDVARYAWALRAKKIAMFEMQSLLDEVKKELQGEGTKLQHLFNMMLEGKKVQITKEGRASWEVSNVTTDIVSGQ